MSTQLSISERDLTPLKTVLHEVQHFFERCNTQRTASTTRRMMYRARDEQAIRRLDVRLDRAIADLNLIVATRAGMATSVSVFLRFCHPHLTRMYSYFFYFYEISEQLRVGGRFLYY
ncbi:unnamed protein product [Scytosiphon promiscuus]